MSVEDLHVGDTDDITLLSATIDKVGRDTRTFEIITIHRRCFTSKILSHNDMRVAIDITLHTVACTIDIEGRILGV